MSAKTLPPLYIPASREPVHSQPSWSNDGRTSSGNLAPSGTQTRATGHAEIRTTTTSAPDVDLTKVTYELGAAFRYFWQAAVDILEIVTSAPVMAADGLDKGVKGLPLPGHEGAAAWGSGPQRVGPQPSSRGWDPQPSSRGRSVVAPMYRSGTGRVRLATMATAGAPTGGGLPKPPSGQAKPPSGRAGQAAVGAAHTPTAPASTAPMARMPSQPSQKLAGGTLGLPRAGYATPPRSPSSARQPRGSRTPSR